MVVPNFTLRESGEIPAGSVFKVIVFIVPSGVFSSVRASLQRVNEKVHNRKSEINDIAKYRFFILYILFTPFVKES
jgi:hypothetical protein